MTTPGSFVFVEDTLGDDTAAGLGLMSNGQPREHVAHGSDNRYYVKLPTTRRHSP